MCVADLHEVLVPLKPAKRRVLARCRRRFGVHLGELQLDRDVPGDRRDLSDARELVRRVGRTGDDGDVALGEFVPEGEVGVTEPPLDAVSVAPEEILRRPVGRGREPGEGSVAPAAPIPRSSVRLLMSDMTFSLRNTP
ncbi:hypothetical protein [Halosegnis marinus]|uniref:hypothetical protein n=1 Tax=Halosegnis marinus TaxID=3034023 RepID=UPI003612C53C